MTTNGNKHYFLFTIIEIKCLPDKQQKNID